MVFLVNCCKIKYCHVCNLENTVYLEVHVLQTAGKPAEEIAVSVDIRPTVYEHRTDERRTSSSSWSGQRHVLICADGYVQTAQIKRLIKRENTASFAVETE